MKVDITYISPRLYDRTNITQWMWFYRPYRNVRGFIVRIFGVYINVREKNATEKLVELFKK